MAADGSIEYGNIGSNQNSYLDRCKQVGRLGPPKTELDINSVVGEIEILQERVRSDQNPNAKNMNEIEKMDKYLVLDVTAKSNFVSVRANTAVTKECFYYEVTLLSDGLM